MELPSVNAKAAPLVKALIADADALRVDVTRGTLGECRIDCGVRVVGGLEAGRRIAEICLGGLGRVALETTDSDSAWPFMVTVHTTQPVLACLVIEADGAPPEALVEHVAEACKLPADCLTFVYAPT